MGAVEGEQVDVPPSPEKGSMGALLSFIRRPDNTTTLLSRLCVSFACASTNAYVYIEEHFWI